MNPEGGALSGKEGTHNPIALETVGICKRFGTHRVLENISFKLSKGSFHALLGGNGAGKSTLVKCIMGYYCADEGSVLVGNHERAINNTGDAHRYGLGMVYQQFTLVPDMTVLENLVLSCSPIPRIVRWRQEQQRLESLMSETPFRIPLNRKVSTLSAGEKQKLEILKQFFLQRQILILDEPTSVLTPQEADEILGMIKERTRSKNLTVLVITHKFREVMNFADDVSVLRRGRLAYSGSLAEKTPAMLAKLMLGDENITKAAKRSVMVKGAPRLIVDDVTVVGENGAIAVKDLSIWLHAGEMLGIAGVSGNGQRELVEILSGQRYPSRGSIRVCGNVYTATRAEMVRYKFHCLPEEPLRNACVARMSLIENLALRIFDRSPYTRWRLFLNWRALKAHAQDLIVRYRIKPQLPECWAETLSGGNLQRLVLAREISGEVELLVAANPCFGLDFAATAEIRQQLMAARNRGVAVLLVSEDLDELLELCDRISVMFEGSLLYESPMAEADLDEIGMKMSGH